MDAVPVVVIEPTRGAVLPRLREAWASRELLYFLALRDIKVRYAQTILGWLWAVVQPVGMTLVFMLAFSKLGSVNTDGVRYPVFAFVGLAFWTFFQRAVTAAADSLVMNAPLLTKTSCPRLLVPLSAVAGSLFDLLVSLSVMFVVVLAYGEHLGSRVLLMPLVVLLGVVLATAMGITLSAINVRHRDVRNGLPFAMQLLLFVSPIAYSLGGISSLISINPLVGVVEAFRWSVVGTPPPSGMTMGLSVGLSLLLLLVGTKYFARVSRDFADVA